MISQNISRKVLGSVRNDISPSNMFATMVLFERFHQNSQAVLAAVSINGLTY